MPDFKEYVRRNLPPLGVSGTREVEIVEELALDFQESYERALRRGLSAEQAWQEVQNDARPWAELGDELRAALGAAKSVSDLNPTEPRPKEAVCAGSSHQPHWFRLVRIKRSMFVCLLEDLGRDLIYAVRQLLKSPGFTATAVLMLALGIGANTAIFSLLNAVLLRKLPLRQPEQLNFFGQAQASGSTSFLPHGSTQVFSYPFFRQFRHRNQAFSDVAAIQSFLVSSHGRISGAADLEKLKVELVSGSYFQTLGVNPILGRVFTDADDQPPGAHPIAIASYSWWQNRFPKDQSIVGKTIRIGSTVYTVIGVAPPGFFGMTVGQSPDLWIPLAMQKEISPDRYGLDQNLFQSLHVIARLKPGLNPKQAQANTDVLFRQILRGYLGPRPSKEELNDIQHARIELTPAATGRSELRKAFSLPLKILMVIVTLVLLIACANVANLLLARATARQREIAVRMSLGAHRSRLIRQLLAESGLLGFIGALLGVAFASGASRLLLAMVSTGSELVPLRVAPDAGVLAFTVAVTVLTVFLFGTAPALRATRLDLAPSLKAGRGVFSAPLRNGLSRVLVIGQVALSLVLLAGAGLFLRSLANLAKVDVGFDKQNVLRIRVDPASAGYHTDARLGSMMRRVEERVDSLPGVRGASFALSVFDGGGWSSDDVNVPGRNRLKNDRSVDFNIVGPDYFEIMKMPILLGRALTSHDNEASRKVSVINETMARTYFPGSSPLGRVFGIEDAPEWQNIEVVGVVKDAKYMELEEQQMSACFSPHSQHHPEFLSNLVVRYTGDSGLLVPALRKAVSEIDPNLPVTDIRTLWQLVDDFTVNRRLVAQLSTFFGFLAALLACVGIYGVMSYAISRRSNEFGIRMALGAKRRDVLWVVLRETLSLAIAGVAIGLALSIASSRLAQTLLFGVQPTDTFVMAFSMLAMIVVALFAGYLPARRATRIDPSVALRYE
jgi:predicted permease